MALIEFQVLYQLGWRGKTYQPGLQLIPEDLAVALGWSPSAEIDGEESGGEKTVTNKRRTQTK
ncbi:MAG: hypothetical protein V7K47_17960 [Nostoc sp.]